MCDPNIICNNRTQSTIREVHASPTRPFEQQQYIINLKIETYTVIFKLYINMFRTPVHF